MISLDFENTELLQNILEADRVLKYTFLWHSHPLLPNYSNKALGIKPAVGRALLFAKDVPHLEGNFDNYHDTALAKKYSMAIPAIGTDYDFADDMTPICSGFLQNTVMDYCILSAYDLLDSYIKNSSHDPYFSAADAIKVGRYPLHTEPSYLIEKIKTHDAVYKKYGFEKSFRMKVNQVSRSTHELFYNLLDISGKELVHAFKIYTQEFPRISNLSSSWNSLIDINDELKRRGPQNDNAERLLYLYRLENLLGVNLASVIIGNILELEESNVFFPDGINEVQNLSLLFLFPNSLSRTIYAQYTLQYLKALYHDINDENEYHFVSFTSKIHQMKRDRQTSVYSSTMHDWNIRFLHYCNCFLRITIPITFWKFFITLIRNTHALDKKTGTLDKDVIQDIIIELKQRLSANAARMDSLIIDGSPYANKLHRFTLMESPSKLQKKNLQKLSMLLRAKNKTDINTPPYHPSMPPFNNSMFRFNPMNLYREQIINEQ